MILTDLHVHSTWSDGKNTLSEIAEEACARGIRTQGFSDHVYAPYDTDCCMKRGMRGAYQREVARLKEMYRGRMDIRCGVEVAAHLYCPGTSTTPYGSFGFPPTVFSGSPAAEMAARSSVP